jgi:hypothetical protein
VEEPSTASIGDIATFAISGKVENLYLLGEQHRIVGVSH